MIDWYHHDPGADRVGQASLMLPAHQDYPCRADRTGALTGISIGLKRVVGDYALRTGRCPDNEDPRVALDAPRPATPHLDRRPLRPHQRRLRLELALNADSQPIDGKALRYEGYPDAGHFAWVRSGGSMPERYRPYECRNNN